MKSNVEFYPFTVKSNGIARVLYTPIIVSSTFKNKDAKSFKGTAIWDTGATSSVITSKIVEKCNLISISKDKVHTAGGLDLQNVYLIDIVLPNGILVNSVRVTEAKEIAGADALIGMDIISLGDFAISNVDKKTVFSFRIPSCEIIDYHAQAKKIAEKQKASALRKLEANLKQHGNEKCPCGSGKKFRYCCGKEEISKLKRNIENSKN